MDNLLLLTHDIIVERAYSEFFDWNVIFPLTLQSTFVTIRFIFRSTSIALSEKKTKRCNIISAVGYAMGQLYHGLCVLQ